MKKAFLTIFLVLIFAACNEEDAPDCFQTAGKMISEEVELPAFEELIVYGRIKLYIEQGEEQKVVIKSGENLISEVTAEVQNGRLSLRNGNECNFFREYDLTSVHITVPNLSWLQNAGNNTIESVGELHFPEIWLRSFNQEKDPEIYTNGDFDLHLVSDYVRITSDNYSNFFLTGETRYFDVYIADGDTRLEAADFPADIVEIQHRGTNKLIVNPLQTIKGEIRSTGDVISVRRPENVSIETFYSGKLIFQ
ncbi:head GIN domain-containing protein [Salinimicrobium sp. GXAS 041]|uniref:head GIN domain-containing protein n=1 Tax=Salinimicrobium sp. GXAS 041 TaxID=3400806 RepID=UPI003C779ED7